MRSTIISRGLIIAVAITLMAGIFATESLAAKKSTTPTSFHRSVTIPKSIRPNNSNNEDSFFNSNSREAQREQRNRSRNSGRRNAKVNNGNTFEARTQEAITSAKKSGRSNKTDRKAMKKQRRAQSVNNGSSGGLND